MTGSANPSADTANGTLLVDTNNNGGVGITANTHEKSNIPSSASIIAKDEREENTDDGLRTQWSEEEKQVYDYAVQKLLQGNDKIAKVTRESAFIYARMAE